MNLNIIETFLNKKYDDTTITKILVMISVLMLIQLKNEIRKIKKREVIELLITNLYSSLFLNFSSKFSSHS